MNFKPNSLQKKVLNSHGTSRFTRRDFMGVSLGSLLAYGVQSSFWGKVAFAQTQPDTALPFLVFDLVGGAALPGSFLVGKQGGSYDLLTSYDTLGYDPRQSTLDNRFGLPAPKDISQFLEGMISEMSEETQQNFKLTAIAHQAVDDVNTNVTSSIGLVTDYLIKTSQRPGPGLGSQGTASGGRTRLSLDRPDLRVEQLSNVEQLRLFSGLAAMAQVGIPGTTIEELVRREKDFYFNQFKDLDKDNQTALRQRFEEAMEELHTNVASTSNLDPRQEENTQTVYQINQNTNPTANEARTAGIVLSAINGITGPSCVALGGYDYHDTPQANSDNADRIAGQNIGRAVELASRLNKPLFIQVVTDGGCGAKINQREWDGDRGDKTLTLMGHFDPNGVKQVKTQIGHFTDGQIADVDTYVGRRTGNVANAVFLNYLAAQGKTDDIAKVISEDALPANMIDEMVAFDV